MTRKTALILASIVALVHLLLACYYASITPYRTPGILLGQRGPDGGPAKIPDVGAPDERQHANYVLHLLDGKGFPVLDPKDPNLGENYQSHQPPLFYLLEAGWTKITSADIESSSDGLKVRSLNALIGAVTVVGVFFVGLWGFKREDVGVIAATFAALLPMNCALSGSLSNDPLLYCLVTWTLAFCAKGIREGWDLKLAIATGVATGLAIITKTTERQNDPRRSRTHRGRCSALASQKQVLVWRFLRHEGLQRSIRQFTPGIHLHRWLRRFFLLDGLGRLVDRT